MKRVLMIISAVLLGLSLTFSINSNQAFAHHNVYWGNMQVLKGQIGKVDILKTTNIYKIKNKKLVYYKKVNAKDVFRVYEVDNKQKIYDIGSSQYIKINSKSVKYTAVPKNILDKLDIVHKYATRGTYWGDSQKQVKKVEKAKYYTGDKEVLIYKTKKFGYNAQLVYHFSNNKLDKVFYKLDFGKKAHHWGEMNYIHDTLAKEIVKDQNIKVDGYYSSDGYSSMLTMWQLKNKDIVLSVKDNKYDYSTDVMYLIQSNN
ncbi:hypothetical protein H5P36_22665 [Bacillus sp. APMAM]|nr:hypothetical protein [Bacillus sp. APMAM]RTZ53588.1 hypothetical protein EKO25_22520 [Bacillus sp. SAJ1]